ncbi:MAG: 2-C-methyl-D-erythritol 4-phosphate cytidylyltransferase [Oscillospiraceae bacterium]|nr:2-C-methyl-D-erythritol 4-phosphate cytidylyltransferase [Oscillospiraceae bacterium]
MLEWLKRLLHRPEGDRAICTAVVPAAGTSSRMGGRDKLMEPLGGMPVLLHTLRALDDCPQIDEIIVVTRSDLIASLGQLCRDAACSKVSKLIVGGETRTHSVLAGIREARKDAALIAIHDGARPLVSQEILQAVITKAAACGAAAPAVPTKDTIKRASHGVVSATLVRDELFAVQTPQVFEASMIRAALEKTLEEGVSVTDDCTAIERMGMSVCLTQGSYENIKITTPEDLAIGEALLNWRDSL